MRKRNARNAALARRAHLDPSLGAALGRHVLAECPPPKAATVAGFWPLPGEIDIRPLLTTLAAHQKICLPVTPKRGEPLAFRRWHPGMALVPGRFGTHHPTGEPMTPDWLLVPLLAYDRAGHRLGYGGGYYDRTLAALPNAFAIGCAYAALELDDVPHEPTDIRLPAIATEHGVIHCSDGD